MRILAPKAAEFGDEGLYHSLLHYHIRCALKEDVYTLVVAALLRPTRHLGELKFAALEVTWAKDV